MACGGKYCIPVFTDSIHDEKMSMLMLSFPCTMLKPSIDAISNVLAVPEVMAHPNLSNEYNTLNPRSLEGCE